MKRIGEMLGHAFHVRAAAERDEHARRSCRRQLPWPRLRLGNLPVEQIEARALQNRRSVARALSADAGADDEIGAVRAAAVVDADGADAGAPGAGNPLMTAIETGIVDDEDVRFVDGRHRADKIAAEGSCGTLRGSAAADRHGETDVEALRERSRAHQVSVSQTGTGRDTKQALRGTLRHYTAQIRRATDAQADSVGVRSVTRTSATASQSSRD